MQILNYTLVDVFTDKKFGGNQLAVFKGIEELSTETMHKIASELNLSEITFVTKPQDSSKTARVRIFTPKLELPMAGHPTVGTAYVLASEGLVPIKEGSNSFIFEEGVGDIEVEVVIKGGNIESIEMNQPIPVFGGAYSDLDSVAQLLSIDREDINEKYPVMTVSSGVPFLYIPLKSLAAIKKARLRNDIWEAQFSKSKDTMHIFTFTDEVEEPAATVHCRMFAPAMGIPEDPATGGATGPLAAYLIKYGLVSEVSESTYRLVSEQGIEMGRPSKLTATVKAKGIELLSIKVGGSCVTMGTGQLQL